LFYVLTTKTTKKKHKYINSKTQKPTHKNTNKNKKQRGFCQIYKYFMFCCFCFFFF